MCRSPGSTHVIKSAQNSHILSLFWPHFYKYFPNRRTKTKTCSLKKWTFLVQFSKIFWKFSSKRKVRVFASSRFRHSFGLPAGRLLSVLSRVRGPPRVGSRFRVLSLTGSVFWIFEVMSATCFVFWHAETILERSYLFVFGHTRETIMYTRAVRQKTSLGKAGDFSLFP